MARNLGWRKFALSPRNKEEAEWIAAFVAARTDATFLPLYRLHSPRLFRIALRITGGRTGEAEEVVQEVWTRALSRLDRFEGNSALSTWLQGIAINCMRERRRSTEREQSISDEDQADLADRDTMSADASTGFGHVELEALDLAVAALPIGFREIVTLHDIEGQTHKQIAEILGISIGTSKSQLARARRRLRHLLAQPQQLKRERS